MVYGWIPLSYMFPEVGKYVDITDGQDVDVGFYEGDDKWTVCIGCVDPAEITEWKSRPIPPRGRPEIDKKCKYIPQTFLGRREAIVLYFKDIERYPYGFHVTDLQYAKLNGGKGRIYGRTEWGPFCELDVYEYNIISSNRIEDKNKLEEIAAEMSW